jgi:hypothetical protein
MATRIATKRSAGPPPMLEREIVHAQATKNAEASA